MERVIWRFPTILAGTQFYVDSMEINALIFLFLIRVFVDIFIDLPIR
jgi:hypothetical protein